MTNHRFVSVTPEQVALLQLEDCCERLDRVQQEPLQLLQAAKALHTAMVAALTAALAGSSGTGAYQDKVKERWLRFLESEREAIAAVDLPRRVLSSGGLLERACQQQAIEWLPAGLTCSPDERDLIDRLTFIRDEFEHPKPGLNSFEQRWVAVTFPAAASITHQALHVVAHHIDNIDHVSSLTLAIEAAASKLMR
jgi:hypothetical protein